MEPSEAEIYRQLTYLDEDGETSITDVGTRVMISRGQPGYILVTGKIRTFIPTHRVLAFSYRVEDTTARQAFEGMLLVTTT